MSPNPPMLTFEDVYKAVEQAVEKALRPVQRQIDSMAETVEKVRDAMSDKVSRSDLHAYTLRDISDQRYAELQGILNTLESRVKDLELAIKSGLVQQQQRWQTIAFMVSGWVFSILILILSRLIH